MGKGNVKAVPAKEAATVLSGETAVSTVQSASPVAFELPSGIKTKRIVTVPSLVLKNPGDKRILYIVSPMRVSKVVDKPDAQGKKREPATICDVGDVETGEQFVFLVPALVKSNLERDYLNDGYVGLTFYIECMGKRTATQRYHDFRIIEVEVEAQSA